MRRHAVGRALVAATAVLALLAAGSLPLAGGLGLARASGWAVEESQGVRLPVPGAVVDRFDAPEVAWDPGSRGVKLSAAEGEPVRAALGGTVSFAGEVAGESWVTVQHGGGLDTTYGVEPSVVVGRRVRAGQVVGAVPAGADRVHWGARLRGEYLDPLSLLERWRPRLAAPGG